MVMSLGPKNRLSYHPLLRFTGIATILSSGVCGVRGAETASAWDALAPYFQPPKAWAGQMGACQSLLSFTNGQVVSTLEDWARRRLTSQSNSIQFNPIQPRNPALL
jgi:hypothetical protein